MVSDGCLLTRDKVLSDCEGFGEEVLEKVLFDTNTLRVSHEEFVPDLFQVKFQVIVPFVLAVHEFWLDGLGEALVEDRITSILGDLSILFPDIIELLLELFLHLIQVLETLLVIDITEDPRSETSNTIFLNRGGNCGYLVFIHGKVLLNLRVNLCIILR